MKIACPQCNNDCKLPNPVQGCEQKELRCNNCQSLINPDDANKLIPAKRTKPVRRIIVVPSTKPQNLEKNSELARPDLLEKAKMLVATKNEAQGTDSAPAEPGNLDADKQVGFEQDIEPVLSVTEQTGEPRTQPQRPTFRQKWLNIAAVIGALLIFGGGLIVRDRVVAVVPSMADLFKLAGFNVNSPGLEFTSVTSKTVAKNGGNILIIEGMIRNISGKAVKVPAVRLLMRAADKQEIYSWFHEPEQMRLQAGKSMMFTTHLFGPPLDVQDVHLKFTERRKQQAKLN